MTGVRAYGMVVGLRLLAAALAGIFVAVVTTVIPPAEFGSFNLALSVLQVVGAVTLSWPNQALLRYGREEINATGAMGATLGARLAMHAVLLGVALALVWGAAWPLAPWIGIDPLALAVLLSFGLVFLPLSEAGMVAGQAGGRFLAYGGAPVIQRGGQLAAALGLSAGVAAWMGAPWAVLMIGTVGGYAGAAVLAWAALPRRLLSGLTARGADIRRLVSYSWALPAAMTAALLIAWMDLWFIRWFHDSATVGVYAWAYMITVLTTTLLVPLAAVLAPRAIDRRLADDGAGTARALDTARAVCAAAGALVPLGLAALFGLAAIVDLGPYAPAVAPLAILAAGVAYQLAMALVEPVIYAHERLVPRMAGIVVAMAAVNALGDILLIPLIGLQGAALATASAYAAGMMLQWRMMRRHLGHVSQPRPLSVAAFLAIGPMLALGLGYAGPWLGIALALAASAIMIAIGRWLGLFSGLSWLASGRVAAVLRRLEPGAG